MIEAFNRSEEKKNNFLKLTNGFRFQTRRSSRIYKCYNYHVETKNPSCTTPNEWLILPFSQSAKYHLHSEHFLNLPKATIIFWTYIKSHSIFPFTNLILQHFNSHIDCYRSTFAQESRRNECSRSFGCQTSLDHSHNDDDDDDDSLGDALENYFVRGCILKNEKSRRKRRRKRKKVINMMR